MTLYLYSNKKSETKTCYNCIQTFKFSYLREKKREKEMQTNKHDAT